MANEATKEQSETTVWTKEQHSKYIRLVGISW